ncbi:unnamed protein product [Adineta steineri]|uniref:Uncharacterized protein n=1 Tax=Adineta steineri TaxID=433720 RepID=A0A818U2K0_9BILA|nr:unnamed protein product [Adineta steineri]CAF3695297.1 unnamed protein product [Adineta steineri]
MIGSVKSTLFNVSQNQCICQMIQSNIFAINYYQTNNTCQLFNYNVVSSPPFVINAFWSFDGTLNDRDSNYNGVLLNNASFCSPGITGYGSALCFNVSRNQSVSINPSINFNLSNQSFTFEYWIYPYTLSTTGDRGMVGQCQNLLNNLCLHMTLRVTNVRISFLGNQCTGGTTIIVNKWYHLTFVYDYVASTQRIYLNGILECNHSSSTPLQITNITYIPLTIGMTYPLAPFYFDGIIDQLTLVGWVKNASDILNDATLVAWYNFYNNSYNDYGPNGINGSGINTTFNNNTLLFNGTQSYFQSTGFVLLGIDNSSYSFSLWINPSQTNASTILLAYQNSSSYSIWCSVYLGFTTQGQIQAQSQSSKGFINVLGPSISTYVWTHIAQTYSSTNGISLYINGSLFNRSASINYRSGCAPLTVRLGNSFTTVNQTCLNTTSQGGQYIGWMDEFRVYSRELSSSDVQTLSSTR